MEKIKNNREIKPNHIITVSNLCKIVGNEKKVLFENINFSIDKQKNTILIGNNGQGKSTLAKIIAGKELFERGTISTNENISYFDQDTVNNLGNFNTVYDYLASKTENYWEVEEILMSKFNFEINFDQEINNLSQGQKQLLTLVTEIHSKNDFIILDEPTNHLDIDTIENLINYLRTSHKNRKVGFLTITHDIDLISNLSDNILEIENKKVVSFEGTYNDYLEQKTNLDNIRLTKLKKLKSDLAEDRNNKNFISNKSTNGNLKKVDNDKYARDRKLGRSQQSMSSSIKKLNKDIISTVIEISTLKKNKIHHAKFGIEESKQSKFMIANIKEGVINTFKNIDQVSDSSITTILKKINFNLHNGQKISLQGKNGSGKTVLLNSLFKQNNNLTLNAEKYILKEDLKIGYFNQNYLEQLDSNLTVIENFKKLHLESSEANIRKSLSNMLFFDSNDIHKIVHSLSGGEKVRLALAIITANPLDILVLDEPDNNLDILTKQILTEAINQYSNCLILITHDRHFLHQVNITDIWKVENGVFTSLEKQINK